MRCWLRTEAVKGKCKGGSDAAAEYRRQILRSGFVLGTAFCGALRPHSERQAPQTP
jgi:hypothetical protein